MIEFQPCLQGIIIAKSSKKKISTLKLEQENYDLNKAKGAQICSPIKYIDEKNTIYFLNLEKSRGVIIQFLN